MTQKNRSKFGWLKRLFLMAVIAPFVLLWGEAFTRILLPQNVDSRMNIFKADPVIGFTYIPHARSYEKGREYNASYEINDLGLRDREREAKKDGVFRVLLVGDSFSVSHGLSIEDSLAMQMERALQEIADADGEPVKFEVINAAVGGYSPYNYWKAYRRWKPVFEPDLVLVGLSPDDYDCGNENLSFAPEPGGIGQGFSIRLVRKWLSWNSEFYILLRNFLYYNDLVGAILQRRSPGGVEDDYQLQSYMVAKKESISKIWSKTFSYMRKFREETAADGVPLVVMALPLKMEIDTAQYRQVLATKKLEDGQIDLDQPLEAIADFCRTEKLPLLDPRAAIRKHQSEVPCYFVYDGHWNAEGVRVGAASMARQWRQLGIAPWALSGIKAARQ